MNPKEFLNKKQREIYDDYRAERKAHMNNGSHMWMRISANHDSIESKEPEWVAIWEDDYEDGPMKVTIPSGQCIGELMKGGIHCPIEAHWNSELLIVAKDGEQAVVAQINAPTVRARFRMDHGGIENEWVIDYRRPHNEIAKPMTFQEAHEYIFAKDVPQYAWGTKRNRPSFLIIPKTKLPPTRRFRNSWRLADYTRLKELVE